VKASLLSRNSDEQIVSVIRETEAGLVTGASAADTLTFYIRRRKVSGMKLYEVNRVNSLEVKNACLRKQFPEAILDKKAL